MRYVSSLTNSNGLFNLVKCNDVGSYLALQAA